MNNQIMMISVDYLRDQTSIDNNVDSELLFPHIITAQNLHIEHVLGTALFDKILEDISNGSITGVYKILLDKYIQPTLAQWSFYVALPFINYSVNNKGISTKDDDNSTAIDLSEVQYLRGVVRDMAEYNAERVTSYLKENVSLFPEYQNPGSGLDTIRPSSSSYFAGIVFDDSIDNCGFGEGSINIPLN